jgi:hypothetical protein
MTRATLRYPMKLRVVVEVERLFPAARPSVVGMGVAAEVALVEELEAVVEVGDAVQSPTLASL